MIEIWASQPAQELVLTCDRGSWIEPIGDQRSKKRRDTKKWLRGFWLWIIKVAIKGQREWVDRSWVVSVRRSRVNPHKIIDSDRCCPPKLYVGPVCFVDFTFPNTSLNPFNFCNSKNSNMEVKGTQKRKRTQERELLHILQVFLTPTVSSLITVFRERERERLFLSDHISTHVTNLNGVSQKASCNCML